MDLRSFAEGLRALVEKTPLLANEDVIAVLIANPRAGGFAHPAKLAQAMRDLALATADAAGLERRTRSLSWRLRETDSPRHATALAAECLEESALKPKSSWFVILACGDGTSLEFLDELSRAPDELRDRFTVLRLPMGTGNDGSDGRELADSLSRLLGKGAVAVQPALRVRPAP
ncbi:MAG: hypothetical protein CVV51_14145, partial [Spirochaetae bacterium HGW-Spirochaetae-7]